MYSKKITVGEVNKYLSKTINMLLTKYGKVSNPSFEEELEEITGIRWKQVKNYKNHPKPNSVVNINSKIQRFVFEQRKEDKIRTLLPYAIILTISTMILLFFIYIFPSKKADNQITNTQTTK